MIYQKYSKMTRKVSPFQEEEYRRLQEEERKTYRRGKIKKDIQKKIWLFTICFPCIFQKEYRINQLPPV